MSQPEKEYTCYCITNGCRTYVGATVDFNRRIRQHNQEIKGGAKYTKCTPGEWRLLVRIIGFDTWSDTLKFEWRWKHIKKYRRGQDPVKRRFDTLGATLKMWNNPKLTKVFPETKEGSEQEKKEDSTDLMLEVV